MSYAVVGRRNTVLMTNLKFGNLYDAKEVKNIKVFEDYESAWEVAEKRGCYAKSWVSLLEDFGKEKIEFKKKVEATKKKLFADAQWREVPSPTWVLKEEPQNFDLLWFDWFEPKRMLLSKCGQVLAVEGYTPDVPCIHTYDYEEVDYLREIYDIEEKTK